jgi:heterogeneous nuclear rnp K-like protein
MLVTSKEAGILIGKNGSQITALREQSNTNLSITKMVPKVNERIVQINGTEESIRLVFVFDQALELIIKALGQDDTKTNCKLLVAHQLAGAIIGKKGARIKSIQEETGTHIVISKELLPQSTERTVEVSGTQEDLYELLIRIEAVKMVFDSMLEDWKSAVGLIHYDPAKRDRRDRHAPSPRRSFH